MRFDSVDRPSLVTRILSLCLPAVSDSPATRELYWWNQSLSTRIGALLQVVGLTVGTETLRPTVRCSAVACKKAFEIDLPISALLDSASNNQGEVLPFTLPEGQRLALRRPTGLDQSAWRALKPRSRAEALQAIVKTLVVSGECNHLADAPLEALAGAMEEFDPLVSFRVQTQCPHCMHVLDTTVDLEALALDQLRQVQRQLLHEIHQLAGHYGWSEQDTLAVPAWRRAHYLRMIAETQDSA